MNHLHTSPKLTKLQENLGTADTVALIQTALPIIIGRRDRLNRFLLTRDFAGACDCAHKSLGSVRLYGTSELESLLAQVKTLNGTQDNLPEFQCQIFDEFSRVIEDCNDWLENNK